MRSPCCPLKVPDPGILNDHSSLVRQSERRGLLRGGLTLGALTLLTGCDVTDTTAVGRALRAVSDGFCQAMIADLEILVAAKREADEALNALAGATRELEGAERAWKLGAIAEEE